MSRIRTYLTVAAGAAAGLFLAAFAANATANADALPINPGLPGVVEQMVASSTSLPQQLLQTTTSVLGGNGFGPAAAAPQGPLATATLTVPPTSSGVSGSPANSGMPSLSNLPNALSSVLPFPLPNFGAPTPAPTSFAPRGFFPTAPVSPVAPMEVTLIPGLP